MTGDGRKSSEDRIREANQRLRPTHDYERPSHADERPSHADEPGLGAIEPESGNQPQTDETRAIGGTPTSVPASVPTELPTFPKHERTGNRDEPATSSKVKATISSTAIRWGLVLLAFGAWYLITGIDDADRDASGDIVSGGDVGVAELEPGDCFDDPDDFDEVVYDVQAVPCSDPHDNEVFAVRSVSSAFPDGFPGEEALQDHAYLMCSGAVFDAFVGVSYLHSSLEVISLTPTAESWRDGDRDLACVLYRLDLGKLTGTARGSGM
jgi:hypothetical protein